MTTLHSCNQKPAGVAKPYFDLKSLLDQQVQEIQEQDPTLKKSAWIENKPEQKVEKKDSSEWATELSILYEADINKPDLSDSYFTEKKDNKIIYNSKDPEQTDIDYLIIYYDTDGSINKVESEFSENNSLYTTNRRLQIFFDQQPPEQNLLTGYIIEGKQKMIMNDTIFYKIESELIYR